MQMIQKTHVTIVGGGFTGCALALHLARLATTPISVTLLEPGKPGRGLAYGSLNPLHRVNVPAERMNLYPEDKGDFHAWFTTETDGFDMDPEALGRDGYLYPRRGDFGRYIGERLAQQTGLDLRLLSVRAVGLEPDAQGLRVELQDGRQFLTGQLVLCNSHGAPDFPWPLDSITRDMAGLITDPWRKDVLVAIPRQGRILILGTGLTMADTLAQLRAQGHEGPITAISRRGLLPQDHGTFEETPPFVADHPLPATPRALMGLLRLRLEEADAIGQTWQMVIEGLRKDLPRIWAGWSETSRRRALCHLRPYWDTRRFRLAPQVGDVLTAARDSGQLQVIAGHVEHIGHHEGRCFRVAIRPRGVRAAAEQDFDFLINCIGPNGNLARSRDPLMQQLQSSGQVMADPTGLGLCVDEACHVLDAEGNPQPRLLALGPLTRSRFAEVMGVSEIAVQASGLAAHLLSRMEA